MNWILENTWGIVIIGLAVEVALLAWLWTSGRARLLWAIAGTALVTAALAILSWSIETDSERVAATVHAAAAAIETNDVNAVGKMIAADSELGNKYRGVMQQFRFSRVNVKDNLRILIAGRKATTTFNVVAVANGYTYPTVLEVHWVKEPDDQWRALDYIDHGFR